MKWLQGKKTYIVSAMMVAVSIINFLSGDASLTELVSSPHFNTLMQGLGLGTLLCHLRRNGFRATDGRDV